MNICNDNDLRHQTTNLILQQRLKLIEESNKTLQKNLNYAQEALKKMKNEKKEAEKFVKSLRFPLTKKFYYEMSNKEKLETTEKLGNFEKYNFDL